MARKSDLVSGMADWTAHRIAENADCWKEYLDTASRLYKYSFDDQLLIYAQRPDATACASMELWNNTMRRWVKGGSKGIALIRHKEGGKPYLDYVFDVADTRPVQGARMPYLWRMGEEHQPAVFNALEGKYGKCGSRDMGKCLMEAVSHAVGAAIPGYLRDFSYDRGSGTQDGTDSRAAEAHFAEVLCASVQYAVLTRCGMDAADYLDDKGLAWITAFSESAAMHHLGNAVSTVSMEILQEIGRAVREQDREMAGKLRGFQTDRERQEREKQKKILENTAQAVYSGLTEEFNDLKHESKERSRDNGNTGVQGMRGIPDPGSGTGRGEGDRGNAVGEIRDAEAEFPDGAPQGDIHLHAADGKAPAASAGDRQADTGAGGPDCGGDDGEKRGGRGTEGERPDGLGAGGKQFHGPGGGDGAAGDRVPLGQETEAGEFHMEEKETAGQVPAVSASASSDSLGVAVIPEPGEESGREGGHDPHFPTVAGQIGRIAMAQEREQADTGRISLAAAASGVPEEVIHAALACGGSREDSTQRIIVFYQNSPEDAQAAAFLEQEYGTWGRGIRVSGKEYALWHDGNGIRIAPGRRADVPGSILISWDEAAVLIRQLLREGKYAAQDRLDAAWGNECHEVAKQMWFMMQDLSDRARKEGFLPYLSTLYSGIFPQNTEKIAGVLQEEEGKALLAAELKEFVQAYKTDKELMRFWHCNPLKVMEELSRLGIQREKFRAAEGFEAVKEGFITEDEVDAVLVNGMRTADKKMGIYACFMQGHGQGKCAAFLRKTYQDGSSAVIRHARCEASYDNKGMRIAAKDIFSGHGGYDILQLGWKEVERRIRSLISAEKYLTPEELAYTTEYEKKQLALQVYGFHFHDPNAPRKGERTWDAGVAERDYLPILNDPKYRVILYQDMVETFAAVRPEEGDAYQYMKAALEAMGAFVQGGYSLFTPPPGTVPRKEQKSHKMAKKVSGESTKGTMKSAGTGRDTVGEGEAAGKEVRGTPGSRMKGKPMGELESAARVLAGKEKQTTKVDKDGQLSFDFDSFTVPLMEAQTGVQTAEVEKEAGKVPESRQENKTEETLVQEPTAETEQDGMGDKVPENVSGKVAVKDADTASVPETGLAADVPKFPNQPLDEESHPAAGAQPAGSLGKGQDAAGGKNAVTLYRETLEELTHTVR